MSGKLDQSLDDILSSRPRGRPARRGRRVATAGTKVATRAPAGGVQKNTKAAKPAITTAAPNGPAAGTGDSKIIVSNLPSDVSEQQIKATKEPDYTQGLYMYSDDYGSKRITAFFPDPGSIRISFVTLDSFAEYFGKSVGPVRRVMLTYGPTGVSRGVATIIFGKPGDANNAAVQLNGMLVDKRPMKIEVVLDANKPNPPKALSERIGQPKGAAKPKPATEKPATNGEARGGRAGRGRGGKRGRNAGRPKPKTADELDAEMMDYFDVNGTNGTTAATGASAAPAANGTTTATGGDEAGMEEIS